MLSLSKSSSSLVLILVLTIAASAKITWTTIDYPGAVGTTLRGINNKGDVVGSYVDGNGHSHGFLLSGGVFTTLAFPGAYTTDPEDINDAGDIVGTYTGSVTAGFLFHNQSWQTIQVPRAIWTVVSGINNLGDIVGTYAGRYYGGDSVSFGFVLRGTLFSKLHAPGFGDTEAEDINDFGEIVGTISRKGSLLRHGFLLRNGKWQIIDVGEEGTTNVSAINNNKQIAGFAGFIDHYGSEGFALYNDNIVRLRHPRIANTYVFGMNDHADVVGETYDPQTGDFHGFIRTR